MSNTNIGFEALFKAAANGDSGAFWGLMLDDEYNRIIGYHLTSPKKLGLPRIEAEDIKSKFMLHLQKQWPAKKPIPNPKAYLRSAIRNFFLTEKRKDRAPDDFGYQDKKNWHKTDTSALKDEKNGALFAKLSEKTRSGIENAIRFIKVVHETGTGYLENETAEKFARTYELMANLEKSLIRIWGAGTMESLPEFRNIEGKKEEHERYQEILDKYPAIRLFNTINKEKDRALKSSWALIWSFDHSFLLIFNRDDECRSFFKLRISPGRQLYDVLAYAPEMKKGKYLDQAKIGAAMTARGFEKMPNLENLRQYRYRTTRLYNRVIRRIYKTSFIDQVNIERPFDIVYQLMKEGKIEGFDKEDLKRAKQIRDQQREIRARTFADMLSKNG